jgi:hypothetical protein
MDTEQSINISVYISALSHCNAYMEVRTLSAPQSENEQFCILHVSFVGRKFLRHPAERPSDEVHCVKALVTLGHRPVAPNLR